MFIFPIFYPNLPTDYDMPPTLYSILKSYVNYGKEEKKSISELAKYGREIIFDFNYPLATNFSKEEFECMILNHFMMRRIGYETMTAFKLALNVKLNEIMPMYNKFFNAINTWEIFEDGEMTSRSVVDSRNTNNILSNTTTSNNTSDRRYSNMPQNELTDIQNGNYITDYNYDTDTGSGTSNSTGMINDNGRLDETIKRTPADKMTNYKEFLKEKQNLYTMIFKDLDVLFYQLV